MFSKAVPPLPSICIGVEILICVGFGIRAQRLSTGVPQFPPHALLKEYNLTRSVFCLIYLHEIELIVRILKSIHELSTYVS